MDNAESSTTATARANVNTPLPRTARRLRSLHLPSSSSSQATSELGRRFNSLRRPTTASSTLSTTLPIAAPAIEHKKVHIRLVPNVGMTNRCFVFDVVDRELEGGGSVLKLGRYSDRTVVSDRLSFKSKVVSRYHAEIWLSDEDGKIYIKDSGSSSGTFVNHIRLAAANTESASPQHVVDGDLIQLGVDYKGGLEPMYRAVRMRLEVNRREWQESSSNTYNLAAFQQLKTQINITKTPATTTYSNLEASVAVEENEVLQMLGLSDEPTVTTTTTSEEEAKVQDDQDISHHHNREKTILDEDILENPVHSSPLIRPSLFFQRQISSSEGGLAATLVGSPPRRFDTGAVEQQLQQLQTGDIVVRDIEDYSTASS
ncbi:hypothetical protein [Parasitella parasitica]|uniref:FHA domain-containing protein n=1 Tax=Parasitella parasitica TaxID=35722 RepID=A0A0B7MXB9_9FUNG|nr:hypothetical protein [Parasitella parasitica]